MVETTKTDSIGYKSSRWRVMERLFWLRNIVVIAQLVVVLVVLYVLKIPLFAGPVMIIITVLWLWNLALRWRLRQPRKATFPISDNEIAINLTVDMLALAGLLYWTGGSTNPFVSLFLVPVVLAAAFLRVRDVVWVVMLGAVLYTLLLRHYVPLPPVGTRFGGDFNLHILGMWGSFLLSAIIAAVFVFNLARTGRQREQELAAVREKLIRNEHIVSVGAMAAGTAHEMNTPLSIIAMLAEELGEEADDASRVIADATEIRAQVSHCRKQLLKLQHAAQTARGEDAQQVLLTSYLEEIAHRWSALRSDIALSLQLETSKIKMTENQNLSMALTNLMDNAADASIENSQPCVTISSVIGSKELIINIDDFGKGLSEAQLKQVGKKSFSTKQKGMGLGLVLSHATLEQLSGRLVLMKNDQGGTRASVCIPLKEIQS